MSDSQTDGLQVDVAVIGGGPAGSTAATLLTKSGFDVLVVEREKFPRPHIGESLLPIAFLALEKLGVAEKVRQAGFVRKYGATYIWGRNRKPWTLRFSEVLDDPFFAYQVQRPEFDKLLLDHSRECGTTVWEETQVTDIVRVGGRVTGLRWRARDRTEGTVSCRYVLDCSGMASLLGKRFRLREFNQAMRHVSIAGYWKHARKLSTIYEDLHKTDDGNLHIISGEAGWFWHIPQIDDVSSVGFITDLEHIRGMSVKQRTQYYLENVRATPELMSLLDSADWISDGVVTDSDWSFFCKRFFGGGYIICGDAACFVDPVLSSGIALAMNGAIRAALALTASLREPAVEPLALNWYEREYRKVANDFLGLAMHWYHGERTRDDWFWTARRLIDPQHNFSLGQAFSLIASGVGRSPGAAGHIKLKHAGGFSPEQLKVIYQNFDLDLGDEQQRRLETYRREQRVERGYQPLSEQQLLTTALDWVDGVRWQPYMLEDRSDVIRPATLVEIPDDGGTTNSHYLSIAAASLLRYIDGRRTGHDIVAAAEQGFGAAAGRKPAALQKLVVETLGELHEQGAVAAA